MKGQEFFDYYLKNLNIPRDDFTNFKNILTTPLPLTFRVLDPNLLPLIENNKILEKIPFLNNVFQCSKEDYKKSSLRSIIIKFTDIGRVYRQEIASMLPVIFLKVQPHHFCLDMCAAPGSKSTQILEILTTGLLVCNDSNRRRIDVLKTHTNKMNNDGLVLTHNDARVFPNLSVGNSNIKYDRILCDVPCSGDGTARKNPGILDKWNRKEAVSLLKTQFEILKRGLALLKDDGVLVYSTCSFNPLENESIVQLAILECNCEIIKGENIEGLKFRKGLTDWDPMMERNDKNGWMFPTGKDIGLEKCRRIYPQDQNTGGFFIAILKKKVVKVGLEIKLDDRENKCVKIEVTKKATEDSAGLGLEIKNLANDEKIGFEIDADQKDKDHTNLHGKINVNEEGKNFDVELTNDNEEELDNTNIIRRNGNDDPFYSIDEDIKNSIESQFNVKLNGKLVTQSNQFAVISLVSNEVYEILKHSGKGVKIISAGCKAFSKNGFKSGDGISFRTKPGVLERISYDLSKVIYVDENDTLILLSNEFVGYDELNLDKSVNGTFAVKFYGLEGLFSAWSGKNRVGAFLDKKHKIAFKEILSIKK